MNKRYYELTIHEMINLRSYCRALVDASSIDRMITHSPKDFHLLVLRGGRYVEYSRPNGYPYRPHGYNRGG